LDLDLEKKKIKPSNLGGIAGGSKFVDDNILFKIVLNDSGGLYGGSVENASKAAVHELKSLNEIGKLIIGER